MIGKMNRISGLLAALLLAPLMLAACTDGQPDAFDQTLQTCLRSTGAPGAYTANRRETGENGLPVIRAGAGATIRGEVLMNGCVEARMTSTAGASGSVAVVSAPVVKPAKGPNKGGLALPSGFALMAGDAELWNSLSRAQQERALQFLKNGSTIRASLGDA